MQAMKARGEPLLTGFECTPAGMAAAFQPMGWELTELLGPKCALPQTLTIISSQTAQHQGGVPVAASLSCALCWALSQCQVVARLE